MTTATDLRALQNAILDNIWTELANHSYDYDAPVIKTLNASYDATVEALSALLGPDAHCSDVDAALFSTYSDLYKDRSGCRPRGHVTLASVRKYVDECKDSDLDLDEDEGDLEAAQQAFEQDAYLEAAEQASSVEDDYQDWQRQAGRFAKVSESTILEY